MGEKVGKRGSYVMVGTGDSREALNVPTRSSDWDVGGISVMIWISILSLMARL